jgi:hypothetical protein
MQLIFVRGVGRVLLMRLTLGRPELTEYSDRFNVRSQSPIPFSAT